MDHVFFYLMLIAMAAVAGTMFFGLFQMAKTGDEARARSQKAMRVRVILQGVALLLFALAALTMKK